jgi:hypothetical protein
VAGPRRTAWTWRVFAGRVFTIALGLQPLERAATGGGDASWPALRVHHRVLRGRAGQQLIPATQRVGHAQRRATHPDQPGRDFNLVVEERRPVVAHVERGRGKV